MSSKHQFEISFYESILKREPSYAEVIELLGGLYTNAGRIEDGLRMDRKLVRLKPDNPVVHYNLACSLALKRRFKEALQTLNNAVKLGYRDLKWMMEDPDLTSLRNHPEFERLVERMRNDSL